MPSTSSRHACAVSGRKKSLAGGGGLAFEHLWNTYSGNLVGAEAQDAALFAELLSLPNDGRYPALDLTPEQRRQRTLEALISQVQSLARSKPVLMIFEDVHFRPTSLEVFGRIVDRIATLRVLLSVTFGPSSSHRGSAGLT